MSDGDHVLICVAWPYANGPLHLGHVAGCYLPPDIHARFERTLGNRVLMVSGSDEHGTPIPAKLLRTIFYHRKPAVDRQPWSPRGMTRRADSACTPTKPHSDPSASYSVHTLKTSENIDFQ